MPVTSNCLPPEQTARFYRIWFPLLHYVNQHRHLIDSFPASPEDGEIEPADAVELRNALWADDALRERFIADNPADLSPADLALVDSWQHRLAGSFFILRELKKYTVLLTDRAPMHAYGVLGLVNTIAEAIIAPLPIYVEAVLLPFENQIIYDSLVSSFPVSFGRNIRSRLNDDYRNAQEREGIITSLIPAAVPSSMGEQYAQIEARNAKILATFRKDLAKAGLSLKTVELHVGNVEAFSQTVLLKQVPPHGLLETTSSELEGYLHIARTKTNVTSFKRFIRFLFETGRMEDEQIQALREVIKQIQE
ncbi:MAG TPA: hypothetical protein VGL94_05870 [Ktedonobacteraceae bacterium]|jgi:hypothetical protein